MNPYHSYGASGSYAVEMIITDNLGCSDSTTKNIIVQTTPTAGFTSSNVCLGNTSIFTDNSGLTGGGSIISWLWDFDDGSTSFNPEPIHTYEQGGTYVVSLTVTNIYGLESEPHTETVQLQSSMPGDINGDSSINILDVVIVVNFILSSETPTTSEFSAADLNSDGILNILDVVILTNLILEA